ncbi:tRNA epoxyqueuosine(34) reductase QueG [Thiomicrospira microaerophila]|nr:tRNA epoxyqueuosine(34) reductase QueG [Thiomicrospira microaerophila]
MNHQTPLQNYSRLSLQIKNWAKDLGFADCGISAIDLTAYEDNYFNWLDQEFHGEMHYMSAHGTKRTRPNELIPGTQSIISLRMNYLDTQAEHPIKQLHKTDHAYVSRYALGRDYHKVIRNKLKTLIKQIKQQNPDCNCRAFVDSAPVLERPIAEQAGLGFIGKNSLIIHPRAGSWFFLAEIYTDLTLEHDAPFVKQGCGPCRACILECPTQAIVADGQVDARRCISYLTIEYKGVIPLEFRSAMGNRIYGCDDCQLVCPWNHFTEPTQEADFAPRSQLDRATLLTLFDCDETSFNREFEGSPIRRIGHEAWIRNIAIALGNSPASNDVLSALKSKLGVFSEMVEEHLVWAITEQQQKLETQPSSSSGAWVEIDIKNVKPIVAKKYYLPNYSH